jgi:hypothetical protein
MTPYRHILIGRRIEGSPGVFARCDYIPGQGWEDGSVTRDRANRVTVVQSNLHALVAEALADLSGSELTLTSRIVTRVMSRGDPRALDLPFDSSLDLLCPLREERANPHNAIWGRVLIQPPAAASAAARCPPA